MAATAESSLSLLQQEAFRLYDGGGYQPALAAFELLLSAGMTAQALEPRSLAAYAVCLAATDHDRLGLARSLCRSAVKRGGWDAEVHVAQARLFLLGNRKKQALISLARALRADPEHAGALRLRASLGYRLPPVLGFLPRSHRLNHLLGRIRYWLVTR